MSSILVLLFGGWQSNSTGYQNLNSNFYSSLLQFCHNKGNGVFSGHFLVVLGEIRAEKDNSVGWKASVSKKALGTIHKVASFLAACSIAHIL